MLRLANSRHTVLPFFLFEFKSETSNKGQEITFLGVGDHRQNGVVKRAIKTIT
jgi:hypothetical protein